MAFVIQVINFGILAIALNIFLYKPIRRVMAERREAIESSRSRAESVDLDVREKMALYEARLQDAKNEAAQRRTEAIRQAQAEESALLEKARSDAAATLASIRENVARESAEARELLKKQAQSLSDDVCEKILGRSL
jgi:F-type H+-transporting ATPase subunit b